jgi:hypothetical protein
MRHGNVLRRQPGPQRRALALFLTFADCAGSAKRRNDLPRHSGDCARITSLGNRLDSGAAGHMSPLGKCRKHGSARRDKPSVYRIECSLCAAGPPAVSWRRLEIVTSARLAGACSTPGCCTFAAISPKRAQTSKNSCANAAACHSTNPTCCGVDANHAARGPRRDGGRLARAARCFFRALGASAGLRSRVVPITLMCGCERDLTN